MEQLSLFYEAAPMPPMAPDPPELDPVLDIASWTDEEVERFAWGLLERTLEQLFAPQAGPATRRDILEWVQEEGSHALSFEGLVRGLGLDPVAMREAIFEAIHLVDDGWAASA